jgi:hypothetical protein
VVEEVREFTGRVAWFGVTVRNFNRYDKKLWPERETNGYVRPKARVRIENLRYAQP